MDDVIQISIAEQESPLTLSVQDDDTPITLTISESGDTPPIYDGETVVVPSAHTEQQLLTKNKLILSNITVTEIPYAEVSNIGGGYTATIAS